MKAKDLAALAALGIAGKMAYDKFGNKTAPGKASPVYDYDTPKQKEQEAYDYDTPKQKEQEAYDYDTPVQKQKAAPIYDNDTPSAAKKATKKAAAASGSSESKGGPSRYNRAADSNDASTSFRNQEEAMAAYVPRRTPPAAQVASTTEEGMQNYVPRRYSPAADSNTASSTAAGMANYVPRRPAVASSTAAGMAAYVPRNTAAVEQARLDALRSSGGRRAKGGVVKMASGGMASSKMSKPSGASRGDGIAQRGRTRGTLR